MKKITTRMLKRLDACSDQVKLFKKVFPAGAAVTIRNYCKAVAAGLRADWAIGKIFTVSQQQAYDAAVEVAYRVYQRRTAETWIAYRDAMYAAGDVRDAALVAVQKRSKKYTAKKAIEAALAYDKAVEPTMRAFEAVDVKAMRQYERDRVRAFVFAATCRSR